MSAEMTGNYEKKMGQLRRGVLDFQQAQQQITPYFEMLDQLQKTPKVIRFVVALHHYPLRAMISRVSAHYRTINARRDLAKMGSV